MTNKLITIEDYTAPAVFNASDAGIKCLKESYKNIKVTNNKELSVAREAIADVRGRRIAIQNREKEIKKEINDLKGEVSKEATRLIDLLTDIEEPLKEEKKKYEDEQKRIKEEKARIEQERIDKIKKRINSIKAYADNLRGKTSAEIKEAQLFFKDCMKSDSFDYQEFKAAAEGAVNDVNCRFDAEIDNAIAAENFKAEQQRLADERAKFEAEKAALAKQKAEMEQTNAIITPLAECDKALTNEELCEITKDDPPKKNVHTFVYKKEPEKEQKQDRPLNRNRHSEVALVINAMINEANIGDLAYCEVLAYCILSQARKEQVGTDEIIKLIGTRLDTIIKEEF